MIMGHIEFAPRFDHFIHAFHMPMFFFVSGYFFNGKKEVTVFMKKKIKSLLIPYIFFGTLYATYQTLYELMKYRQINISYFYHTIWDNTTGMAITGALWFLTALFIAESLYYLLNRLLKKQLLRNGIIIFLAVAGMCATKILPFRFPWGLDVALVGMGFIHLGAILKQKQNVRIAEWLLNKINFLMCIAIGGGYPFDNLFTLC